jgi:hypothetical protein
VSSAFQYGECHYDIIVGDSVQATRLQATFRAHAFEESCALRMICERYSIFVRNA